MAGYTFRLAVVSHGELEFQDWPTRCSAAEIHKAAVKYQAWSSEMNVDAVTGSTIKVRVAKIEIIYREVQKNVWDLLQVEMSSSMKYPQPPIMNVGNVESYASMAHRLKSVMPGLNQKVPYPCGCKPEGTVWGIIQHLNDRHHPVLGTISPGYTREEIAQWTENLSVDLTIDPKKVEVLKRQRQARRIASDSWADSVEANAAQVIDHLKKMADATALTKEQVLKMMDLWIKEEET